MQAEVIRVTTTDANNNPKRTFRGGDVIVWKMDVRLTGITNLTQILAEFRAVAYGSTGRGDHPIVPQWALRSVHEIEEDGWWIFTEAIRLPDRNPSW